MRYLLDVNVVIALIDPTHVLHRKADDWFFRTGAKAWATCPTVENGVLRIVANSSNANTPGSPATVASVLTEWLAHPGHEFWPESISLLNSAYLDRLLHLSR